MQGNRDEASKPLALLILLWPLGFFLFGLGAYAFSFITGNEHYSFWLIGYGLVGAFFWLPVGLILLGLLRFIKRTK